jgi:hypothetical protein
VDVFAEEPAVEGVNESVDPQIDELYTQLSKAESSKVNVSTVVYVRIT